MRSRPVNRDDQAAGANARMPSHFGEPWWLCGRGKPLAACGSYRGRFACRKDYPEMFSNDYRQLQPSILRVIILE